MDEHAIAALAQMLRQDPDRLSRHLSVPLRPTSREFLNGWRFHPSHAAILSISDGFVLFRHRHSKGFVFYGSSDLSSGSKDYVGDFIADSARRLGIVPIFGEPPHCVSVQLTDGAVVESDWESPESERWLRVISPSIHEYVATLILVREAYGDSPDGFPSDWWYPYARFGARYDLK